MAKGEVQYWFWRSGLVVASLFGLASASILDWMVFEFRTTPSLVFVFTVLAGALMIGSFSAFFKGLCGKFELSARNKLLAFSLVFFGAYTALNQAPHYLGVQANIAGSNLGIRMNTGLQSQWSPLIVRKWERIIDRTQILKIRRQLESMEISELERIDAYHQSGLLLQSAVRSRASNFQLMGRWELAQLAHERLLSDAKLDPAQKILRQEDWVQTQMSVAKDLLSIRPQIEGYVPRAVLVNLDQRADRLDAILKTQKVRPFKDYLDQEWFGLENFSQFLQTDRLSQVLALARNEHHRHLAHLETIESQIKKSLRKYHRLIGERNPSSVDLMKAKNLEEQALSIRQKITGFRALTINQVLEQQILVTLQRLDSETRSFASTLRR